MNLPALAWGFAASLGALAGAAGETPMALISSVAVSPDGNTVAFEWCDDLWTAPSAGGEAVRVVNDPAHDASPQFSPDGKRIVFSSDRTGSMQVFSIPLVGGESIQHTHHTEGNELECLSPDGKHALVRGIREHSGSKETRLMEIDLTADHRERKLFDVTAHSASWSPDGTRVLFCRGGESLYRKGYKGSRASQIWEYDIVEKTFASKVAEESEARSPIWAPDGKGFHHISARSGTGNVWYQPNDGAAPVPITTFTGDGVVSLSLSGDGSTMVFQRGFDLYRFRPKLDSAPQQLEFLTQENLPDVSQITSNISGTTDVDFTRNSDQMVFSAAGDLWWQGEKPLRLTSSSEAECDVHFSPDGEWLYFLRDDGLEANYFRARLTDGKLGDGQAVTRGMRSKSHFIQSRDGSKITWAEATGDVFSADADGANSRCVFKCWDMPAFDFSPDGCWLAIAAKDRNSNSDIWLTATSGKREPISLTPTSASEESPCWSPDGRCLVFAAHHHADAPSGLKMIRFGEQGLSANLSDEKIIQLTKKAAAIPTHGIEPIRVMWTADSKTLLFQNSDETDHQLHSIDVDGDKMETLIEQRGIPIRTTKDGALLWKTGRCPAILKDGKLTRFPIQLTVEQSREAMLRLGFRRIWRTLGERFYDPSMNGNDWRKLLDRYESFATGARNSRQFERVVNQFSGELNASHLGFVRKSWPGDSPELPHGDTTAYPGMEFRNDHATGPLIIDRVLAGSPVATLDEPPQAGEIVVKIAGEEVSNLTPLHRLFNGAADRTLPVVLRSRNGRERVIELRCISYQKARLLEQKERDARSGRFVEGDPGISLIPVPDMSMETSERIEQEVYQASLKSSGIILDLRNNGGGREADRLLSFFCQPVHLFTVPRDGQQGYPNDRLTQVSWKKPLVVLSNENTFSNAEIFCHAIQQIKRAPLVGTATAGGVISAVKVSIPDVGVLQVPFRGWFHAETGENLDLNGAKPDHPVSLTPADENAGRDPQLEKALEVIREEIRRAEKPIQPQFRK